MMNGAAKDRSSALILDFIRTTLIPWITHKSTRLWPQQRRFLSRYLRHLRLPVQTKVSEVGATIKLLRAPCRTFNSALLACGGAGTMLAYLVSDENGTAVTDHLQTS